LEALCWNELLLDPYAKEAKHFTEIRVLNRDVWIVLEGVYKFSNLIGSVYYPDGDVAKDLSLELVENGLAKYVEWSASMMEEDAKRRLKNAQLQAKNDRLRIWINYVPPPSNSKEISDDKFTRKVVEVVSGDCIVVADDSAPYGSPLAERRVNLSSIRDKWLSEQKNLSDIAKDRENLWKFLEEKESELQNLLASARRGTLTSDTKQKSMP
jgi:staphylococcal nuclease domain-containing protein 1